MPAHARAWGRRGILAYQAGNVREAADRFAQVVALEPADAEAWNNLGAVQIHLGQYAEAEASLRRALALRPDYVDALNNLGNVLVACSRWDEAAPILERTVALGPSVANGWVNLGHARKGQERYAEAIAAYERALALQPRVAGGADRPRRCAPGPQSAPAGDRLLRAGARRLAARPGRLRAPGDRAPTARAAPEDRATSGAEPAPLRITAADLDRLVAALRQALALDPDCPQTHSYLIVCLDVKGGAEAEANEERRRWNARFGGQSRARARPCERSDPTARSASATSRPTSATTRRPT